MNIYDAAGIVHRGEMVFRVGHELLHFHWSGADQKYVSEVYDWESDD